jgi:hypothetical protein
MHGQTKFTKILDVTKFPKSCRMKDECFIHFRGEKVEIIDYVLIVEQ